jgi:hemerythrin-like domain-containing protein
MSAAQDLREEHRRIEQILVLLRAEARVDSPVLTRFAADLTAHLEADVTVLYPVLERALNRPLAAQRELQSRLRQMLCWISVSRKADALRCDRLRQVHMDLQEHCRFEERVALPVLESLMDAKSLETLGQHIRNARSSAFARHAKAIG